MVEAPQGAKRVEGRSMKEIPDFPDYFITKDGQVFSEKYGDRRKLKTWVDKRYGYVRVIIRKERKSFGRFIHVLLLTTYIGKCPIGKEASHLNGNRADNRLENLCWETRKENHAHKIAHGTRQNGDNCGKSKLTSGEVVQIKGLLTEKSLTQRQIAKRFKISEQAIHDIKIRRTWK